MRHVIHSTYYHVHMVCSTAYIAHSLQQTSCAKNSDSVCRLHCTWRRTQHMPCMLCTNLCNIVLNVLCTMHYLLRTIYHTMHPSYLLETISERKQTILCIICHNMFATRYMQLALHLLYCMASCAIL